MNKRELLKNLNRLGFSLLEPEEDFDVNKTLAEVVKSKDTRLWEGFPVLLANAASMHDFNYDQVVKQIGNKESWNDFHLLITLSLALYSFYHISFVWAKELEKKLRDHTTVNLKEIRDLLVRDDVIISDQKHFSSVRLKETFQNYFRQNAAKTKHLREKYEDLSLEYALSQLFSPKQKELFLKRLEGEPLSKTEREYYSRTVKKKVAALANPELHRLAQQLMQY
jgi:hypothetical protein